MNPPHIPIGPEIKEMRSNETHMETRKCDKNIPSLYYKAHPTNETMKEKGLGKGETEGGQGKWERE